MARRNPRHRETPTSETAVVRYTNRMGDTYYLHEGRTKTGKVRYFVAKTPREGVLSAIPDGYELAESINGVVSVRKIDVSAASIPEADVALARAELARHAHLHGHRIEVVKGEIVVFEAIAEMSTPDWVAEIDRLRFTRSAGPNAQGESMRSRRVRYGPVMKYVPLPARNEYTVNRMTYRGDGGWSWPLASGSLHALLKRFLGRVGTDEFYELL